MFTQSSAIRDYVFPLATVKPVEGEIAVKRILGSAFLIGGGGYALTAKHVISDLQSDRLVGMFALADGGWYGFDAVDRELHPSEDVALVKLDGGPWKSFFRLSNSHETASCKYRMFGYPDDATFERDDGHQAVIRPDLVYNEGYIRRRLSGPLPAITGSSFFELSEVAGSGASGAPVCKAGAPTWDVIGIYVGEKTNDRATSVSYAVREDSFRNWIPRILGRSVLEESRNVTLPF